jgi:hypothetical protein
LPQINTRTYARAVIAVLGLAACSNPSTAGRTTTAFSIDFGPGKLLRAELVSSATRLFQAEGLTITNDQANCMANGLLNEFGMDELDQLMRDSEAGEPDDPAVMVRGAKAIVGCLPADVVAALASRND